MLTLQNLIQAIEKAKVRNYDITADEVNYFIDAEILLAELRGMEEKPHKGMVEYKIACEEHVKSCSACNGSGVFLNAMTTNYTKE